MKYSVASIPSIVKPRLHACVAVSGGVWFLLETPDHLETIVQVPAAGHWPLPSLARVTPDCGLLGPGHKYLLQLCLPQYRDNVLLSLERAVCHDVMMTAVVGRIVEVNGANVNQENHKQVVTRIKSIENETRLLGTVQCWQLGLSVISK